MLGPNLFLRIFNNSDDVFEGKVWLFTDDSQVITSRSDFNILQQNLRAARCWSEAWALPLNTDKCVHLPIGQRPAVPPSLHYDAPISTAESTGDLGVFETTNFKPSLNARLAVLRAHARLSQIHLGFVVMTKTAFAPGWKPCG